MQGGPTDRVQGLPRAFDDAVTDRQFIVAAKQANMYINPMGGEELQAILSKIRGAAGTDADVDVIVAAAPVTPGRHRYRPGFCRSLIGRLPERRGECPVRD